MRLVFNRSFTRGRQKSALSMLVKFMAYNCSCEIPICIQRLLADAAVSEILAAAYDCLLNPKLARQRGNCAGQSDHNFAYMV